MVAHFGWVRLAWTARFGAAAAAAWLVVSGLLAGCSPVSGEPPPVVSLSGAEVYNAEACFEAGGAEYHWRGSRRFHASSPTCVFANPLLFPGDVSDCYSTTRDWPTLPDVNKYVIELLAVQRGDAFDGDFSHCATLPVTRRGAAAR